MNPTARALLAAVHDNPGDTTARMVYADALQDAGDEVGAHLQRAIAEPDNYSHRLALADALERTAGEEKCELCKTSNSKGQIYTGMDGMKWIPCPKCKGSRVSDGRKEWAEFIRVQCELAARDDERCRCRECQPTGQHTNGPCRSPLKPLRRRERELWPAVRGRFEGYGVEPCYQTGLMVHQPPDGEIVQRSTVIIQRGLPAVVRCTLAEWMGERCERCRGTRLIQHDPPQGANFHAMGSVENCPECHGEGRTLGIGPRLAQAWPIERVETEKRPLGTNANGGHRWTDEESFSWGLPKEVFERLPTGPTCTLIRDAGESWGSRISARDYDSESAARAALSDAMIAWARGQSV